MNTELKKNGHPIYLLYVCGACGKRSSMRPVGASTNFGAFCSIIASCVFKGNMEYCGKRRLEGFRLFHRDYRNESLQLSSLKYGLVEQMEDGKLFPVPMQGTANQFDRI